MYKVAILGCENSHANSFLDAVINRKLVTDIEFVGVYSYDKEAAQKLQDQFGVYVAESYDEFVGKVDGIMITARHGDHHYQYAKPYLESGIPMFIDKPITCTDEDAAEFMAILKEKQIPVSGGSMLVFSETVKKLKEAVETASCGKVLSGFLKMPINKENPYGNFHFYSQHIVQSMMDIFGYNPRSVKMDEKGDTYSCVVKYDNYDVLLAMTQDSYYYYGGVFGKDGFVAEQCSLDGCSDQELLEFRELFEADRAASDYEKIFAPVYVINAMDRSIKSGCEEKVEKYEV